MSKLKNFVVFFKNFVVIIRSFLKEQYTEVGRIQWGAPPSPFFLSTDVSDVLFSKNSC